MTCLNTTLDGQKRGKIPHFSVKYEIHVSTTQFMCNTVLLHRFQIEHKVYRYLHLVHVQTAPVLPRMLSSFQTSLLPVNK